MTKILSRPLTFPEHLQCTRNDTPIIPLKHFFADLADYEIWMKRDDFTGVEMSGNKVRKLDFLVQDALDRRATHLITCGGLQSNHCRTTAFIGLRAGLKVVLVLRGEKPDLPTGNYFLNQLSGARMEFITPEVYRDVDRYMEDYARNHEGRYYIIPEGGSNETGAWGYIRCFEEIRQQQMSMRLHFDTIVVATGSGGTHAGLLLGKLLTGSPANVISVNVCDSAEFFTAKIERIMDAFCKRYSCSLQWSPDDINVVDGFVGSGYGLISDAEVSVIQRFAASEGIILDPVYGAKAFAGMEHLLRSGKIPGRRILFIHTGGIFGIFPYGAEFAGRENKI